MITLDEYSVQPFTGCVNSFFGGAVQNRLEHTISNLDNVVMDTTIAGEGKIFPRLFEFAHSKDTKELGDANMYTQASCSGFIREMIEIATNKTFVENCVYLFCRKQLKQMK